METQPYRRGHVLNEELQNRNIRTIGNKPRANHKILEYHHPLTHKTISSVGWKVEYKGQTVGLSKNHNRPRVVE